MRGMGGGREAGWMNGWSRRRMRMRNQYPKYNLRAPKEGRRRGRDEGRVLRTVYFLKGNADMGGYTYIYIRKRTKKYEKTWSVALELLRDNPASRETWSPTFNSQSTALLRLYCLPVHICHQQRQFI